MYTKKVVLGLACTAICMIAADQPQISVLTIETDNVVTYVGDVVDPLKLALVAGPTTAQATRAFTESITIGDVVSINGRPAKGLWQTRSLSMGYSPTAAPGFSIADSSEGSPGECKWAILTVDGMLVGRFQEGGVGQHQITGGSGVFLGIRGTQTVVQAVQAPRRTSMTEDPSLRRSLGGGTLVHTFHLAPSYPPAFVADSNPAIYHANFAPVTAASPAGAGEVLLARVMNLGFTTPSVDPGAGRVPLASDRSPQPAAREHGRHSAGSSRSFVLWWVLFASPCFQRSAVTECLPADSQGRRSEAQLDPPPKPRLE